MFSFLNKLFGGKSIPHSRKRCASARPKFQPCLEVLENRTLLTARSIQPLDEVLYNKDIKDIKVKFLEQRTAFTAGITAGITMDHGVIRVKGHDDAFYKETVEVSIHDAGTPNNPFDDWVVIDLTSQRGDYHGRFKIWKRNASGLWERNVTRIDFSGYAGDDDFINRTSINSYANGGAGNDVLLGGSGADQLLGGADNDTLVGNDGNDRLIGERGEDWLEGRAGKDTLGGGLNNDTIIGGTNTDQLMDYGDVNFILTDAILRDVSPLSEFGTDTLSGIEQAELYGGSGNNTFDCLLFSGVLTVHGGAGNDTIYGGLGSDSLYGDLGNDTLYAGNESCSSDVTNFLYGGQGNDSLIGSAANDVLKGGDGNDYLQGNAGNDSLYGEGGQDTLRGGAGNDVLHGGAFDGASDHLYGDTGTDIFYRASMDSNRDRVWDRETGEPVIS